MVGAQKPLAVGGDPFLMAMASPVRPAARYEPARLPQALRVSGWSAPRSRSLSAATRSSMAMASPMRPADQYERPGCPGRRGCRGGRGRAAARGRRRPAPRGDGLAGAPRRPVRGGQVAPGCEGVGVVGAEEPLAVGGDLLLKWRWPRRCAPPTGTRRPGCPGRSRVSGWSGPRSRSRVGGDLLLKGDGLAGAPRRPVRERQVGPGCEGVGVVGAEEPLGVGGDLLLMGDGLAGAPRRPVRKRPGWPGR